MKKNLIFFMVVAIVALFGWNNGASADPAKVMFKGDYNIVAVASDNVQDMVDEQSDGSFADKRDYVMQRFRLTSIAATENVKGVLGLEIGWDEWGKSYSNQSGLGAYSSTGGGSGATGGDSGVITDTPSTNIEVWMAYIDFKIPDTGVSIMAGKAPLYTYQQVIQTGAGPSPGIQATWAMGGGSKLKVYWTHLVEGKDPMAQDWTGEGDSDYDFYYAEYGNKTKAMSWGVYGGYARDYREIGTSLGSLYYTYGAPKPYDVTSNWLGAYASFMAGPLKLILHGAYSSSDFKAVRGGVTQDRDGKGYYLRAMGFMKTPVGLLSLGTMYTPGDSDRTDHAWDGFRTIEGPTRYPSLGLFGPGPNIFLWGNGVAAEEFTQVCLPPGGTDYLGRWYTNVGLTIPMGKYKFIGELWIMRTVEDPSDPKIYNQAYRDEEIGNELDFELHYALTKNLTLQAEFDYMIAGDYFANSSNIGPDSAYLAAVGVKYAF
jgi:hypothetical protein